MLCQFNIFLLTVHSWSPVSPIETMQTIASVYSIAINTP